MAAPEVEAPESKDVVLATTSPSTKPSDGNATSKPAAKPVAAKTTSKPSAASKPKAQIVRAETNGIADYDEGTILASWFQRDR